MVYKVWIPLGTMLNEIDGKDLGFGRSYGCVWDVSKIFYFSWQPRALTDLM